jgi:protease-4
VASDTIWRETVRAREAGKPVIVSMGNVAGSGGYFVAMAADKIVAQPGTITGSIGVFAGKPVTAGLRTKLGLATDEVHTSSHATMWSDSLDYSPGEWDQVQGFLDRAYDDFTSKVASGRRLTLERVHEVARGRIWTGEEAKRIGLVDELGGYNMAMRLVREAINRPPDASLRVKVFPRPETLLDRLRPGLVGSPVGLAGSTAATIAISDLATVIGPIARFAADGNIADVGVLTMPAFEISL